MDFNIRVYIPSTEKFEYIKELTNKETLAISKFIKANDDYGLSSLFDSLLKDIPTNNIVDKFFILCQLRALNISNKIVLSAKHLSGENATYRINLFSFLGDYLNHIKTLEKEYVYEDEQLKIYFKLPTNIYFKNFYVLLNDIITKVEINGKNILEGKNQKETFDIILKFNSRVISGLKNYLNKLNNNSNLFFVKPTEEILVPTIKVSFFNNTIFNILKSIFKTEILYFYNKFFVCLTKLGLSYDDYLKLSYVETDILLNIYKSANKLK